MPITEDRTSERALRDALIVHGPQSIAAAAAVAGISVRDVSRIVREGAVVRPARRARSGSCEVCSYPVGDDHLCGECRERLSAPLLGRPHSRAARPERLAPGRPAPAGGRGGLRSR